MVRLEKLELRLVPGLALFPRLAAVDEGLSVSLPGRTAEGFCPVRHHDEVRGRGRAPRDIARAHSRQESTPGRAHHPDSAEAAPVPAQFGTRAAPGLRHRQSRCGRGDLQIVPHATPEKKPLQFDLNQLRVQAAGVSEPMRLRRHSSEREASRARSRPRASSARWFSSMPAPRQYSGDYVFADADLSVFKGIGGTLLLRGPLRRRPRTYRRQRPHQDPDFQLTSAGLRWILRTDFEAVVDGTNGDTLLSPVNAILASSDFQTAGGVGHRAERRERRFASPPKALTAASRTSSGWR